MSVSLGKEVGYSVRFDYNYNDETRIKFLTEGMFIRELLIDPLLKKYKVVIIDDCHERTINCELILGFLKKIFSMRKDLKIIISSATLDYSKENFNLLDCYMKFFSSTDGFKTDIFCVNGRTYPVDIHYLDKPIKNYVESAVYTALNIHKNNPKNSGDILVFLTGQEEINNFIELSHDYGLGGQNDVLIMPLISGLPVEKQLEVFSPTPHNKRKIVLSTNIAESSVTIENIAFVIDSCFVKLKFYNPKYDSDALYIIPASKFSLDQRAGRAGRTRPGKCYRLITKENYKTLYLMTNPELIRSNLVEFILRLKSMGVKDISKFETLTEADRSTISRALENLYFLEILDDKLNLTELGKKTCDLPLDPRLAVALFHAGETKFKCTEEILAIVSMLSIQNLFQQPKDPSNLMKAKQTLGVIEGDHLTLLNIFKQYKYCKTGRNKFCKDLYLNENAMKGVEEMFNNLKLYLKKYDIRIISSLDNDGDDVLKSFLKGFFLNIAQKQNDGSYRSLRWNTSLFIHPTSVVYTIMPEFIFYNEVVVTAKNYIKEVSKINKEWILEVASHYYEDKTKKIIQDRHKEEVRSQSQVPTANTLEDRLKFSTKSSTSKIYMKNDHNKDPYHLEDSDNDDGGLNIKPQRVTLEQKPKTEEDDEEHITMLRRMRKRK
jgi:HrpA-like RNA helicase